MKCSHLERKRGNSLVYEIFHCVQDGILELFNNLKLTKRSEIHFK